MKRIQPKSASGLVPSGQFNSRSLTRDKDGAPLRDMRSRRWRKLAVQDMAKSPSISARGRWVSCPIYPLAGLGIVMKKRYAPIILSLIVSGAMVGFPKLCLSQAPGAGVVDVQGNALMRDGRPWVPHGFYQIAFEVAPANLSRANHPFWRIAYDQPIPPRPQWSSSSISRRTISAWRSAHGIGALVGSAAHAGIFPMENSPISLGCPVIRRVTVWARSSSNCT
jgi:hypothetical protein